MRIRTLVFTALSLVAVLGAAFLYHWVSNSIRPSYLKVVEENLVDTSRLLAAILSADGSLSLENFAELDAAALRFRSEQFEATIYDTVKSGSDLEFYITGTDGIVLFHSHDSSLVGADFSGWNDVHLTLSGHYGVRTTRTDPGDATTSRLHVAAPLIRDGTPVGVLTVIKPITWPYRFMEQAREHVWLGAAWFAGCTLLIGLLLSAWITAPLERLARHADALSTGSREPPPHPGLIHESRRLLLSFTRMREALDGKDFVEQYISSLTHEIKSPLAGIQGAAELLDEEMDLADRRQFLGHIRAETNRLNRIVEHLLQLSGIEGTGALKDKSAFSAATLLHELLEDYRTTAEAREVSLSAEPVAGDPVVEGDPDLLRLALACLLQNAIEFSPAGSTIAAGITMGSDGVRLTIRDHGPGIPDYARERVFERFFSLPRPDTGRKSSGLGLTFAREIAALHHGSVHLENHPGGGTLATLILPVKA